MNRWLLPLIGFVMAGLTQSPAFACGERGAACEIDEGAYHIRLPSTAPPESGYPAILYFHGAGGSGEGIFLNEPMAGAFLERGYAVIGPNGLKRPNSRFGPGWSFRTEGPQQRDEMAFTKAMMADAAARHGIDLERVTLSGYSIGGSLVWYLACQDHEAAFAYAPFAGGFWRPHPEDCSGPVKLIHTHGWRDQTVPLEGRPLRNGQIFQGDVFEGFQVWRRENGCERLRADSFSTGPDFWRRVYTSCAPGTALEFVLHPGGHERPSADWAEMVVDWLDAIEAE
ncbi:MAG: alpha/beta fold hydrolase [Pseudomonadota bacterium]